jgi:hypothetical protein
MLFANAGCSSPVKRGDQCGIGEDHHLLPNVGENSLCEPISVGCKLLPYGITDATNHPIVGKQFCIGY